MSYDSKTVTRSSHGLKQAAKAAVAQTLYAVGLLQLWGRVALRGNAIVLTYHRVLPADALDRTWSHPGMIVTRESFDRHMALVRRLFRVLTLPEFLSYIETGAKFASPSCLVTFDDGWLDTYEHAWPVLRRHGVPAVVFMPVEFIGTNRTFWQERLGRLLCRTGERMRVEPAFRARCLAALDPEVRAALEGKPDHLRVRVYQLVSALKARDLKEPVALIETLRTLVGPESGESVDVAMGWDEARLMARDGVTFGGHGATHRILTTLSPDQVEAEIETSKRTLERELGVPATAFSYPNGNWNEDVADLVSRGGFKVAFSTAPGHVAGSPRYGVRRVNMHEDATRTNPLLLARMVGLL